MTSIVDAIAQHIRTVDGDNKMSAAALGRRIGWHLADEYDVEDMTARTASVEAMVAFVERVNPDKTLGAGRLAELIVDEFDLDEED
jgi:hypothetical protein